jgi:hypothetical protein
VKRAEEVCVATATAFGRCGGQTQQTGRAVVRGPGV